MEDAILNSPWFNYYEKLRLWHIHNKAFQDLAFPASFQQQVAEIDITWLGTLLADLKVRDDPQQQEEVRRRLNWHDHCSARLWALHRSGQEVESSFTNATDLVRHIQGQGSTPAGEWLCCLLPTCVC